MEVNSYSMKSMQNNLIVTQSEPRNSNIPYIMTIPASRLTTAVESREFLSHPNLYYDTNNFHTDSSTAGISMVELVRKLETENLLNHEDRLALNRALNDCERRDFVIITLQDIELGTNLRFAFRRLKMLIHQNLDGLPSSDVSIPCSTLTHQQDTLKSAIPWRSETLHALPKFASVSSTQSQSRKIHQQNPLRSDSTSPSNGTNSAVTTLSASHNPDDSNVICSSRKKRGSCNSSAEQEQVPLRDHIKMTMIDSDRAISSIVGDQPVYSGPGCYGVCTKIGYRLMEHNTVENNSPKKVRPAKFAVLVGTGSCNPLTRMHMRSYFLAKQYLENTVGYVVLGSILCPSHGVTVRERYRNHPTEVIPSPHRLAVAQLMVESSKWLSVDPWEITRRRPMDYLSLLQHCRKTLTDGFPDVDIKIIYLCKENMVPKISPLAMKGENFGCISVCRYAI